MKILHLLSILVIVPSNVVLAQNTTTNSIGMEFVRIEPGRMVVGEFTPPYPVPDDTIKGKEHAYMMWMGDGRGYNEKEFSLAKEMAVRDSQKGFVVTLNAPYYLGRYEVTQAQWQKVMGYNPSVFQSGNKEKLPVENITWEEAKKFVRKLNKREKTNRYRLPTEFEWEYAARAGAEKDIPWNMIESMANLNKVSTMEGGSKSANDWGLYDMLGNVWEWVDDIYNEKIFADENAPSKGKQHVLKGASFTGDVKNATYMTHAGGPGNGWDVGFRILMMVENE